MFGKWVSFAIDQYFPKCGPRIVRDPPTVSRGSVDVMATLKFDVLLKIIVELL
jgi:hypothetical protein